MRSAQAFLHWIEAGRGARGLRLAAVLTSVLALSLLVAWKQFRGPQTESTLLQADVGRHLAEGDGFKTFVIYPQTVAVLEAKGRRFDALALNPELHEAPLYAVLIGGALAVVPPSWRATLFTSPADISDGYGADYVLLGVNLALLWLAAWLTYLLGRQLFDARVGWLAALGLLVSLSVWQQTLALNGTTVLMVLALGTFLIWHRTEQGAEALDQDDSAGVGGAVYGWMGGLGALCGLLFLAEYSAGTLVVVAVAYAWIRFRRAAPWAAAAAVAAGFLLVVTPWLVRNVDLTGNPVALAAHDVALKAGDPTAEPLVVRATLSAEAPPIILRKLANKTLTAVQKSLHSTLWSGGAMWFVAFFAAGWLYAFRAGVTNRLRWVFSAAFAVLVVAQAALNSGASERLAVVWLAPLIIVFGAGFFFVLLDSNPTLSSWPRAMAALLIALQALPLVHDALAPAPAARFQYPPYFPTLLRGLHTELELRRATDQFGLMADVPAGVAWYGGTRVWAQPARLRDFYAVSLREPIGELLLTPHTLDRPFLSELNARAVRPGALSAIPNRFGEWGEIYGGLLTGTLPREFPLSVPQKVSENLFVLLNPALPPRRGK